MTNPMQRYRPRYMQRAILSVQLDPEEYDAMIKMAMKEALSKSATMRLALLEALERRGIRVEQPEQVSA